MRKILLLFTVMLFISCVQTQKAVYQQEETYTQEERTLNVFYNESEISLQKLKKEVKSYGVKILDENERTERITVRISRDKSIEQGIKYFEKIKGVICVEKARKNHVGKCWVIMNRQYLRIQ